MTNAILLPNNIAPINFAGFFKKEDKTLAVKLPLLLSNSIFNLLAETKAISNPENMADANIAIIKKNQNSEIILCLIHA